MKMIHLLQRATRTKPRGTRLVSYSPAINHLDAWRKIVGTENILTKSENNDDFLQFSTDWTKSFTGGSVVVFPKTTEEISSIMKYCHGHRIGVVCQGGNTGLAGGAVGVHRNKFQELIISTKRMNNIIEINKEAGHVVCEAGVILEILNNKVQEEGFIVPLDLGAKGSCMIGGNLSTNAGGLRVIKYGSLQSNILGLEVVLADGTVVNMLRSLIKDNTGIHSKHLFVGSEGTLGIITKLSLRLAVKPQASYVVLAKTRNFENVSKVLSKVRSKMNEYLTAFEFMDMSCIHAVQRISPTLLEKVNSSVLNLQRNVNHTQSENNSYQGMRDEVAILMEFTSTAASSLSSDHLESLIAEELMTEENEAEALINDAIISRDISQEKNMWAVRESISPCLLYLSRELITNSARDSRAGKFHKKLYKYDLTISLTSTNSFLRDLAEKLENLQTYQLGTYSIGEQMINSTPSDKVLLEIFNFGHAGDQNLHLNIIATIPSRQNQSKPKQQNASLREYLAGEADLSKEELEEFIKHDLEDCIYPLVLNRNGSLSAEHGIGQLKLSAIAQARSSPELKLMSAIKTALDPKGILNPGKFYPSSQDEM